MKIVELQKYMKVAGYSQKSIDSYTRCVKDIGEQDLLTFLDKKAKAGIAPHTLNQYHSAYKLYQTKINGLKWEAKFPYSKRHLRIPVVLSKNEVVNLLNNINNKKHKLMLSLAYGAGLRVSEVVNITIKDLDFENAILWIREGKGKKDRMSIIPDKLSAAIKYEIEGKQLNDYLFESNRGGKLTTRTAQAVFEKALRAANINKKATFHSLRHSFATHLLESGVSIRYIQELLGHASITTTQIYTKVAGNAIKNIKSPL